MSLATHWRPILAIGLTAILSSLVPARAALAYVDQNLNRVEITNVQQMCDRAFFKRGDQWIDSRIVNDTAKQQEIAADSVITYGSPEHLELLHKLIAQNRQGVLSLDGDIMIQFEGRNILVRNDVQERSN